MVATRFKCPYFHTILAQVLLEYTTQGIPVIVHFTILDKFVNSSGQVAISRGIISPELVVLVDFVFPWGLEYPVVFLPHGLFTLWCLQIS
jgi:hypothetical protein